jgi:hypothetical protein
MKVTTMFYNLDMEPGNMIFISSDGKKRQGYVVTSVEHGTNTMTVRELRWHERLGLWVQRFLRWFR